jgi:hypothetical protein
MFIQVDNEKALKEMVAMGIFPAIRRTMDRYEAPDNNKTLYSTVFEIGEYVDTYHKLFQTGNRVEMVTDGKAQRKEEHI